VQYIKEWEEFEGLKTRLGAPLPPFPLPSHYDHKATRSMGRGALLATLTAEDALREAGLLGDPELRAGRTGIAFGAGTGSTAALREASNVFFRKSVRGLSGTTYHRMMSHSCAANIGIFFGITGRILPTSSACTSGSLAIGYGYETISSGVQDIMIAGGAEEFAVSIAAIFDSLCACSLKNDEPGRHPRPFDRDRDGLIIGEGACAFILEERDHALARGARPLAEIIGFGTNSDGYHITSPRQDTIERSLTLALEDAAISPQDVDYINAHATGTIIGDIAESRATNNVFGNTVPISSAKGHVGHLLGASGAVEAALTVAMMNRCLFCPTANLENVDPRCAELDYIIGAPRAIDGEISMSNTFAFGGLNTSLLFKKHT
jgi:3-oxoacyl-[acyl-carrier-protein] synthase II